MGVLGIYKTLIDLSVTYTLGLAAAPQWQRVLGTIWENEGESRQRMMVWGLPEGRRPAKQTISSMCSGRAAVMPGSKLEM